MVSKRSVVQSNKMIAEITSCMVCDLCDCIVERDLFNPVADIKPSSTAMFKPRDRTLPSEEVGVFFRVLDNVGAMVQMELMLFTLVRKSEFTHARWSEGISESDMDHTYLQTV